MVRALSTFRGRFGFLLPLTLAGCLVAGDLHAVGMLQIRSPLHWTVAAPAIAAEGAVIGTRVRLVAHTLSRDLDGSFVRARAPIEVSLDFDPHQMGPDLGSETCPARDSLGRMALAAAMIDRLGVRLSDDRVAALRSLGDVVREVREGGRTSDSIAPPQAPSGESSGPDSPAGPTEETRE